MVTRNDLSKLMTDAVRFVRENNFTQKEALRTAWRNLKLCKKMTEGVMPNAAHKGLVELEKDFDVHYTLQQKR